MHYYISKADYFRTIAMVMNNHEPAFEGFTEIIDVRDTYLSKNSRIAELLTVLNRPRVEFFNSKRDVEQKLRSALRSAVGTGITVAKRQQNIPLLTALKSYKKVIANINQHSLPEVASRVSDELSGIVETVTLSGLSAERFAEFQGLISSFREIMAETDYIMSSRKTARAELSTLTAECNGMLRDELDSFVENRKLDFPDFYSAYFIARKPKRRKKRKTESAEPAEIYGTVTDSVSGLPLAGAVINLLSPESIVTTDEDGIYVLDELEAGTYTVSCHLEGYDVPANVTVTAVAGDSLVVDFTLTPVQQQQAA